VTTKAKLGVGTAVILCHRSCSQIKASCLAHTECRKECMPGRQMLDVKELERDGGWRGTPNAGTPHCFASKSLTDSATRVVYRLVRMAYTTTTTLKGEEERFSVGEWRGTWGKEGGRKASDLHGVAYVKLRTSPPTADVLPFGATRN